MVCVVLYNTEFTCWNLCMTRPTHFGGLHAPQSPPLWRGRTMQCAGWRDSGWLAGPNHSSTKRKDKSSSDFGVHVIFNNSSPHPPAPPLLLLHQAFGRPVPGEVYSNKEGNFCHLSSAVSFSSPPPGLAALLILILSYLSSAASSSSLSVFSFLLLPTPSMSGKSTGWHAFDRAEC